MDSFEELCLAAMTGKIPSKEGTSSLWGSQMESQIQMKLLETKTCSVNLLLFSGEFFDCSFNIWFHVDQVAGATVT